MKVFILTLADKDLCEDQSGYDNAQDILWTGAVFWNLEAAKEAADEDVRSGMAGEDPLPPLKWTEEVNETPNGATPYWTAECEENGHQYMIRETMIQGGAQ